jgi:hypothetical protein
MENTAVHKIYISTEEVDNFQKKKNDDLYEYKYDEESTTYIPVSPKQRRKQLNNDYLSTFVTVLLLLLILPLAFHKLYYSPSQSAESTDFVDCQKALLLQNNHSPFVNHPHPNSFLDTEDNNRQIFSMFEDLDTIRDYELRNKLINRKHMMI